MLDVTPRSVLTDTDCDAVVGGYRVDIKTTQKKGAPLWIQERKKKSPAEVYGLAYCDPDSGECELQGFISKSEAMQEQFIREVPSHFNGGVMRVYSVDASLLHPTVQEAVSAQSE